MQRHDAWHLFISTREELLPLFDRIADPDEGYHLSVMALDEALDILHDAVQEFGVDDLGLRDDFDDIQTPMFDALSYVTQARSLCRGNGVRVHVRQRIRELVEHAREELETAFSAEIPY